MSPTKINALQLTLQGFNVIANVDHTRRGTAIALRDHIRFSHVEKSLDGRLVAVRVQNVTLCCVYAPSGTEHVILAGDFNCVLRQTDSTGHNMSPSLLATVQG